MAANLGSEGSDLRGATHGARAFWRPTLARPAPKPAPLYVAAAAGQRALAGGAGRRELLLVVEDSGADRTALERALRCDFPAQRLELVASLAAARAVLDASEVSVAIVDYLLPDGCGLELLDAHPEVPAILVTGNGSERIAVEALRRRAVDYVRKEKGFRHFGQVRRAVETALALGREARAAARAPAAEAEAVRFGDFELDLARRELREFGEPLEVHRTPMRLLAYLVHNADRTVSKEELLERVWEGTLVSDTAIASALKELRHVLRDDGARQRVIRTRRGSGYRFVAPLGRRAEPTAPADEPSLAVLPLESLSEGSGRDCLALGMTDALIDALARIGSLRVLPRTSVMRLRDHAFSSVRDVGRELGVDLLVSGSIARDGPRVRVCAELLEVASERLLWIDHYDRETGHLLDLESEVAQAVERKVRRALAPREGPRTRRSGPPARRLGTPR